MQRRPSWQNVISVPGEQRLTQPVSNDVSPTGIKARLADIRKLERAEGPEEAERALISLIREFPDAALAYASLARILMKQKKNDYAARAAEKAAALTPLDPKQHTLLGVARMRNDDLQGASTAFAQALQLDKKFAQAIVGAAAVKMADENYDDALALCDRALDINPGLERASELVARIRMKQGDTAAAADELRALLERDGSNDRALRAYMRLMRKEGTLDEVVSLAEVNLSTEPASPRSVARYARMVSFAGQPGLAVAAYRELLKSGSARELDKVRFIMALIGAGELDEARQMIPTLKDRRAMRPLKDKLLGDVEFAAGTPEAAVEMYKAACTGARIDGLPDEEAAGLSGAALADAWQAYTARALREALKDYRNERVGKRQT